jgi:RHS repeat-associated protein
LGAAFGPISATNYDLWYAFTGRPLDVATGLYDYRGRPYGAGVGRFFVRDPIGYSGGDDNVYRFCGGNPVIHVDPNGTDIYLINFVHQQICVDAWDRDERGCWHQRHEPICFSFHAISFMPQWYGLSQTWLGWTMWPPILPMLDLPGEIYRDTPQFGMRLATLRTGDPQRDVNWANYMAYQRVRLGDRYNLQWLDCIHYTNNEYGDAPLHW